MPQVNPWISVERNTAAEIRRLEKQLGIASVGAKPTAADRAYQRLLDSVPEL